MDNIQEIYAKCESIESKCEKMEVKLDSIQTVSTTGNLTVMSKCIKEAMTQTEAETENVPETSKNEQEKRHKPNSSDSQPGIWSDDGSIEVETTEELALNALRSLESSRSSQVTPQNTNTETDISQIKLDQEIYISIFENDTTCNDIER